ncbi:hypothetical protein UAY_01493 [Enterococcus moraviensis ATCC BAA-383]|uniref:Uncharacterized protein n=1 Tax=Enterococcus moraviensis ATCC BAA-383 TaxID=1158609 RepID=R2QV62_9ENTE|nr:hypothetical protein [Enterococcus moraviensis]EOI00390.1 hypothetical protein UAY_01493 [Enterococcus moraviensis ATCC BAA-383]EOT73381.1 hypothetical protein I586_00374 [Enterococcus moraviensis ATCC BAA-383]OJG68939.1 hypothetical protein RV09_GL000338 [Enterococcus moraviensis]
MPKHDFKVVQYSQNLSYKDVELVDVVSIDDSLIIYISDSLSWLKGGWNSLKEKKNGLNYYGVTFFYDDEIKLFKSILSSWISLFENAPDELSLKSDLYPDESIKKKLLLDKLNSIVELCNKALEENKVLVHYGI